MNKSLRPRRSQTDIIAVILFGMVVEQKSPRCLTMRYGKE